MCYIYTDPLISMLYVYFVYFWHDTKLRNERNLIFMFIISLSHSFSSHSCGLFLLVVWDLFDCFLAVCFDCVCVLVIIAVTCVVKTINYGRHCGHLSKDEAVR